MGAATVTTPAGKCAVLGQEEYVADSWLKAAYATEKKNYNARWSI